MVACRLKGEGMVSSMVRRETFRTVILSYTFPPCSYLRPMTVVGVRNWLPYSTEYDIPPCSTCTVATRRPSGEESEYSLWARAVRATTMVANRTIAFFMMRGD